MLLQTHFEAHFSRGRRDPACLPESGRITTVREGRHPPPSSSVHELIRLSKNSESGYLSFSREAVPLPSTRELLVWIGERENRSPATNSGCVRYQNADRY